MRTIASSALLALLVACGGSSPAGLSQSLPDAGENTADGGVGDQANGTREGDAGGTEQATQGTQGSCSPGPTTLPDLDTPCLGTITGRAVVSRLQATYKSTYNYAGPPAGHTWTGSTAPSLLTIAASYTGGTITCLPPTYSACDGGGPCPCREMQPAGITLDLDVAFVTGDGQFNEHFTAAATARTRDLATMPTGQTYAIAWSVTLLPSQVEGTYPAMFGPSERLGLSGQFTGWGAGGGKTSGELDELTPQIATPTGNW